MTYRHSNPCQAHRDIGSTALDCTRRAGHHGTHRAGPWEWRDADRGMGTEGTGGPIGT